MEKRRVTPKSAMDEQVGGSHYKQYVIQPAEFFHANRTPYLEASAMLYVLRHRDKNGREDLLKAKHTIDLILEMEYGEDSPAEPTRGGFEG